MAEEKIYFDEVEVPDNCPSEEEILWVSLEEENSRDDADDSRDSLSAHNLDEAEVTDNCLSSETEEEEIVQISSDEDDSRDDGYESPDGLLAQLIGIQQRTLQLLLENAEERHRLEIVFQTILRERKGKLPRKTWLEDKHVNKKSVAI